MNHLSRIERYRRLVAEARTFAAGGCKSVSELLEAQRHADELAAAQAQFERSEHVSDAGTRFS